MNILIVNQYNSKHIMPNVNAVPRPGDVLCVTFPEDYDENGIAHDGYTYPTVDEVYWWPGDDHLKRLGLLSENYKGYFEVILKVTTGF